MAPENGLRIIFALLSASCILNMTLMYKHDRIKDITQPGISKNEPDFRTRQIKKEPNTAKNDITTPLPPLQPKNVAFQEEKQPENEPTLKQSRQVHTKERFVEKKSQIRELDGHPNMTSPKNNDTLQIEQIERSIMFVHVGKAGGLTFRQATASWCYRQKRISATECIQEYKKRNNNTLGYVTKTALHLDDIISNKKNIGRDGNPITSYVVPLRNPIDRIVSAYRFNHPLACVTAGGDCWNYKKMQNDVYDVRLYLAYRKCFPTLNIEPFAQSALSPWDAHPNVTSLPRECYRLARETLMGTRPTSRRISEHMAYNYRAYYKHTLKKFPNTEVFGIRVEHEWEDIIALDKLLGGSGHFVKQGESHFHGQKGPRNKPRLSVQAQHKICCVIYDDLAVYLDVWKRARNFNATTKEENEISLKRQCGVTTTWEEWIERCRIHLEEDAKALEGVDFRNYKPADANVTY